MGANVDLSEAALERRSPTAASRYRGRAERVVNQVVIARTELVVSRLSFGTARLHHVPSRRARQRLLGHASALGFSHFDTAPLYGFGLAEQELGAFLASQSRALTVATKIGLYPPGGSRPSLASSWVRSALSRVLPVLSRPVVSWSLERAERSLHLSLARLRREQIDVLFLHEPDARLLGADEVARWLEAQTAAGKVRYYGLAGDVSRFLPWLAQDHAVCRVLQLRDSLGGHEADAALHAGRDLQFSFGYLSRPATANASVIGASATERIRAALRRVPCGSVLVSSCRLAHVEQLSRTASEALACA